MSLTSKRSMRRRAAGAAALIGPQCDAGQMGDISSSA